MPPTTIRLLHIEDDPMQQKLLARELAAMSDYRFDITAVESEDQALAGFSESGFELVIMDYHLSQGNGLSCLRAIRKLDPIIPVISVSGVATDEIAATLISAGADDYLAKQTINSQILGQSVRNVVTRSKAFRTRFTTAGSPTSKWGVAGR